MNSLLLHDIKKTVIGEVEKSQISSTKRIYYTRDIEFTDENGHRTRVTAFSDKRECLIDTA